MARTLNEIRQLIRDRVAADPVLGPNLTSTSATSIYGLIIDIVAWFSWSIENLHDLFKREVDEIIATKKPHSLRWYAEKAREYQHGFDLVAGSDYYNNTGIAEDVVEASKIIAYAAVVEQIRGLRIKVAKNFSSDLGPLDSGELASFTAYMQKVKDAGVKLLITTDAADALLLKIHIRYNPLVLDASGARIDGTTMTPVKDAIKAHLKNLPFNGVFSVQKLVDAIQAVEGVEDLSVEEVQTQYGALPFTTVHISVTPNSGYLRIEDADLTLTYSVA